MSAGLLFPNHIYAARKDKALCAVRTAGFDAYVALHPTTLHWLCGLDAKSYQSFQCGILDTRSDTFILFARAGEGVEIAATTLLDDLILWSAFDGEDPIALLGKLLKSRDLTGKKLGLELIPWYLSVPQYRALLALEGLSFSDAPDLIHDLRMIRGPEEIEVLRRASTLADQAMAAFATALRPGVLECELAAKIYATILNAGGNAPPVALNLTGGARAAFAHGAPTHRAVSDCECGNAEFAVPYRYYTVSIGRSYITGEPDREILRRYEAIRCAQEAMFQTIRCDVMAGDVYQAGMDVFFRAGYANLVAHVTGYSVAPAFPPVTGERLSIARGSQRKLQAGMTFSIAPNLFDKNLGSGLRLVNNIVVTSTGIERLSSYPDDLINK